MYGVKANKVLQHLAGLSVWVLVSGCGGSGSSSADSATSANLSPPPAQATPQGPVVDMSAPLQSTNQLAAGGHRRTTGNAAKGPEPVSVCRGRVARSERTSSSYGFTDAETPRGRGQHKSATERDWVCQAGHGRANHYVRSAAQRLAEQHANPA